MIDTNIESLAMKAEIKQRLRKEMENSISEDDMKFVLKTFDDVSSRFRFSKKKLIEKFGKACYTHYVLRA